MYVEDGFDVSKSGLRGTDQSLEEAGKFPGWRIAWGAKTGSANGLEEREGDALVCLST